MVKSRAIRVIGLIFGMNRSWYHFLSLTLMRTNRVDHPGDERDAEVDEDALRDLADGDVHDHSLEAEHRGEHRDKDVGVHGKEEHLEDRVEGDEPRTVLRVALRKLIPHDDHGDAAGEADHDEAHHVFRVTPQEYDGQDEHQDGADHPVLHERQAEHLDVLEHLAELLVPHLRKGRVHHENQADGDGNVGGPALELVPEIDDAGKDIAPADADEHGEEDPQGEETVEKRESFAYLFGCHIAPPVGFEAGVRPLPTILYPPFHARAAGPGSRSLAALPLFQDFHFGDIVLEGR